MRTYFIERRDAANKYERGRMPRTRQKKQQTVSAVNAGTDGVADGNARVQSHIGGSFVTDNPIQHETQSDSSSGAQAYGISQVKEPDRSTATTSSVNQANDQTYRQNSSPTTSDGVQNGHRHNGGAFSFVASAATAFDAAKDIMEALRSKHAHVVAELEV